MLVHQTNKRTWKKGHGWRIEVTQDYLADLYVEQNGQCAISKLPLCLIRNKIDSLSIDRIDSSIGYVAGNIQLVCKWVNLAKSTYSNAEILEVIAKLKG